MSKNVKKAKNIPLARVGLIDLHLVDLGLYGARSTGVTVRPTMSID